MSLNSKILNEDDIIEGLRIIKEHFEYKFRIFAKDKALFINVLEQTKRYLENLEE